MVSILSTRETMTYYGISGQIKVKASPVKLSLNWTGEMKIWRSKKERMFTAEESLKRSYISSLLPLIIRNG
jgi:hypothetical protein